MRRRFRYADVPRYDGLIYFFAEEIADIVFNHLRQIVAFVIHGKNHALQFQFRIKFPLYLIDVADKVSNTFQSQKFALQWHNNGIGGNERVNRNQA